MNHSQKIIVGLLVLVVVVLGCWYFMMNGDNKNEGQIPLETSSKLPALENRDQILTTGQASKDDLIGFSIWPGSKVHGVVSYRGTIQGGYFFEANIRINILDTNKNVLKSSNAVAIGDWMTTDPVDFEGNIDFTGLPQGPAYFEIHNDNASDLPKNDKSILIPIVIE